MATDPENISDHIVVGLKMLLGTDPSSDTIADALKQALSVGVFHSLLYAIEARSDVVQLMTIDVDEVLEEMEDRKLIPTNTKFAGVYDNAFKTVVREKMRLMYDDETNSARKYEAIAEFIGDLQRDDVVKDEDDGSTEADGVAEDGAGDSV